MCLKDFARVGHPATLVGSFLYLTIHFMIWVLMGNLMVFIARDLHLSLGQQGFLAAVPIFTGAALRIPAGILADRIGAKRTGTMLQLFVLLPLLGGWLVADSVASVMVVGLLFGAAGAGFAVAIPLASRRYPTEHQGLANGIVGAGNIGTVFAAFLAPQLAEAVGWRQVFGFALLPALLLLVISRWLVEETPRPAAPLCWSAHLQLLRGTDWWYFCLIYAITFGGFIGLSSFLVIFLREQYGLSGVMAGNMAALCIITGSLSRPLGGYLADRLGGFRLFPVLVGVIGMLTASLALLPPLPVAIALLFLGMAAKGLGNGALFQVIPQRFENEIGAATGIVGAAGGLGGFFLPTLLGLVKDLTGSFSAGLFILASGAFATVVALRALQVRRLTSWLQPTIRC